MMKYEWKKHEKNIYLPGRAPEIIDVPEHKYIMIEGHGNPNNSEFAEKVAILYSISYAIKMLPKKGYTPDGYFDYTVYPLEGIWDLSDKGIASDFFDKNELIYTIMIRQPDFVTLDIFNIALSAAAKKHGKNLADLLYFDSVCEGLSVQMLHVGSFDDEPASFDVMKRYLDSNNLERRCYQHREIYLSDARKTETAKLKTILRYMVKHIEKTSA